MVKGRRVNPRHWDKVTRAIPWRPAFSGGADHLDPVTTPHPPRSDTVAVDRMVKENDITVDSELDQLGEPMAGRLAS